MKITALFFILIIIIISTSSVESDLNLEYNVQIGDKKRYSVIEFQGGLGKYERREHKMSIIDIYGEEHRFMETKGTKYTYEIIHINNSIVIVDLRVDNLVIKQVKLKENMLLSDSSIQSRLDSIHQNGETSLYKLSGKWLSYDVYESDDINDREYHYIWDITTGWLKSERLLSQGMIIHPKFGDPYGSYYEYHLEEITTMFTSPIQFMLQNLVALGIGVSAAFVYKRKKAIRIKL